ncbi:hypothetical protein D3C84_757860 [compost metagenome]
MAQADFVPSGGGQRFGGDDQALHRQLIAPQRRQRGRVPFYRRNDPAAAHHGLRRAQAARLPVGDRTVFVNPDAHAFDRPGQTSHQLCRVQGRHVRCIDTAIRLGNSDLLRQLLGAEPAVMAFRQALAIQFVQILSQAGFLFRIPRRAIQRPAFTVIAVDAFTFEDNFDFIGNAMQQVIRRPPPLGR